jgi:hypothetical protein
VRSHSMGRMAHISARSRCQGASVNACAEVSPLSICHSQSHPPVLPCGSPVRNRSLVSSNTRVMDYRSIQGYRCSRYQFLAGLNSQTTTSASVYPELLPESPTAHLLSISYLPTSLLNEFSILNCTHRV